MLLATLVAALWARWLALPITNALGDAVGPWFAGAAVFDRWAGHTPLYGWASALPYAFLLPFSDSLESAVRALLGLHALAAPLAAGAVLVLRRDAWWTAALAGLLVGLDASLLETAISGHKGYLAPVWIGAMAIGAACPHRLWGAPLACVAFAFAVHNHPLAATALPFLALLNWRTRSTQLSAAVGAALIVPHVVSLLGGAPSTDGGTGIGWAQALPAFFDQGGFTAALTLALPVYASVGPRSPTRAFARCTLAAFALLFAIGAGLGYLRDHHLRLLAVPAIATIAAIQPKWSALALLALRLPQPDLPPTDHPHRPGTLALTSQLTDALPAGTRLLVDGVWISSAPAAEPSAVMLDWVLRGGAHQDLAPMGTLFLIVSGERDALVSLRSHPAVAVSGDRHLLLRGTATSLKPVIAQLCAANPRLGGAGDAMGVFRPDLDASAINAWRAPCEGG